LSKIRRTRVPWCWQMDPFLAAIDITPGYRLRGHTGVDGAGLRVTKKALATKRGRGPNNSSCDPNCSPRKSPLAQSSNAHCGRISHRSRHTQSDRMQSHRNRRMKPESKCIGRTTQTQAEQEPTSQTLNIAATNDPCLTSTNRVHF
jgi:hypothetical protein